MMRLTTREVLNRDECPLAGGHAGESPYRYDPAARLSLTMGYSRDPLHDSRDPWWLPPCDRCAWSPEIARKRTREMERDRRDVDFLRKYFGRND